jgi:hypothetical protein
MYIVTRPKTIWLSKISLHKENYTQNARVMMEKVFHESVKQKIIVVVFLITDKIDLKYCKK